jgi:alkylhydroperoxidase family enzyme
LHKLYGDRVQFVAVYVREAHPTDGWRMASNDKAGITVKQPKEKGERDGVARKCCQSLGITMPMVVDDMDDHVGHLYSGMPDRLYVIDRQGRVAFKSGRGPFGFTAGEMEQALVMTLLDQPGEKSSQAPARPTDKAARPGAPQARVPLLSDEEAWRHLPALDHGERQPLPSWARALAGALPRTTAAMLELDSLHRAHSPLEPLLRGKMRWVAAHANRCAYAETCALADLRHAGLGEAGVRTLTGDQAGLPEAERAALTFSRKLTLAADTVTDAEVARLRQLYGDRQVVAMVLLIAYANFQDRLLLTLNVPMEPGGPLPALDVRFVKATTPGDVSVPERALPSVSSLQIPLDRPGDAGWTLADFGQLQHEMTKQRARAPRIPVPPWDEVHKSLPGWTSDQPLRIRWSLVCIGYQPELANAWSACTRAFGQEAKQDRVFEESLFWVVTRSLNCFY